MATFIATPELPVVTLSATASFTGTGATFDLPAVTLSATLESNYWRGTPILPPVQLTASMLAGVGFTAVFELHAEQLSARLLQDAILSASFDLPSIELEAQFLNGALLSAVPELPVITLESALHSDGVFVAQFDLPTLQLSASLTSTATDNYRTWALNLRKNALTEYDNFPFNSYAVFRGQVLACSSAGVVVLAGQLLDDDEPIDAVVLTGKDDFGVSQHKRVPRLYVDGSQAGDLHFKAIAVEHGTRTYLLPWNHISGHTQRRVPIGKGPKSRYWQFGVENVDGAPFSIGSLMAYPTKLRRRIS